MLTCSQIEKGILSACVDLKNGDKVEVFVGKAETGSCHDVRGARRGFFLNWSDSPMRVCLLGSGPGGA